MKDRTSCKNFAHLPKFTAGIAKCTICQKDSGIIYGTDNKDIFTELRAKGWQIIEAPLNALCPEHCEITTVLPAI